MQRTVVEVAPAPEEAAADVPVHTYAVPTFRRNMDNVFEELVEHIHYERDGPRFFSSVPRQHQRHPFAFQRQFKMACWSFIIFVFDPSFRTAFSCP
jgi:hypothetical protein